MAANIRLQMNEKTVTVRLSSRALTMTTVRSQFFISPDSIISLSYDDVDGRIGCEVNEEGSAFLLPEGWSSLLFFVESQELSRPQTPIHPPNERPPSPYYPAVPPEAAPAPKAFLQWMYYQQDAADGQKDTVVCIHPRYFVTFRHGTHLRFQLADEVIIYKAENELGETQGISVSVVKINEGLDFILLKSQSEVVEKGPSIARAEEAEPFTLAGYGNVYNSLSYLPGAIHTIREYYWNGPNATMGPFLLGTSRSSRGDSGAGIWGSRGLIGINCGCTMMPSQPHQEAISEAATFSAKNIITPALRLKDALMECLQDERKSDKVESPPAKKPCFVTKFDGLGEFVGSVE